MKAEASEFFKFIKHSEYNVVEQLNKTLTRISLLSLLTSSKPHRDALMKVLNQAYVAYNNSIDKLDHLVGNIVMDNFVSFNDDEIPPNGRGSKKALHITTKIKDCILPKVLIDNGFSLNVMPTTTLSRLLVDVSYMKRSHIVVRAFDRTRRDVIGEIELAIQIGPITFNIEFQVMDITPSYNCLLGKAWIHMARVIPSTLHQKIKFIVDGHLIYVAMEEDMIMATTSTTPYVKVKKNAK